MRALRRHAEGESVFPCKEIGKFHANVLTKPDKTLPSLGLRPIRPRENPPQLASPLKSLTTRELIAHMDVYGCEACTHESKCHLALIIGSLLPEDGYPRPFCQ